MLWGYNFVFLVHCPGNQTICNISNIAKYYNISNKLNDSFFTNIVPDSCWLNNANQLTIINSIIIRAPT